MNTVDTYHADTECATPGLSSSLAKRVIEQSPAHAWAHHPKNPDRLPDEESSRLDLGTAAHALLLEGEDVMDALPFDDWRTKAAREARDASREAGRLPILERQAEAVRQMVRIAREKLASCADFGLSLDNGRAETPIYWQEYGVECRALPDWVSEGGLVVLDYKTTTSSSPRAFERSLFGLGYDMQAAWYCRAVQQENGGRPPKFLWLVQEVEPPYEAYLVGAMPAVIDLAWQKCAQAIHVWGECARAGRYPAYTDRILWVEPPVFAFADAEERQLAGGSKWTPEAFLMGRVAP